MHYTPKVNLSLTKWERSEQRKEGSEEEAITEEGSLFQTGIGKDRKEGLWGEDEERGSCREWEARSTADKRSSRWGEPMPYTSCHSKVTAMFPPPPEQWRKVSCKKKTPPSDWGRSADGSLPGQSSVWPSQVKATSYVKCHTGLYCSTLVLDRNEGDIESANSRGREAMVIRQILASVDIISRVKKMIWHVVIPA